MDNPPPRPRQARPGVGAFCCRASDKQRFDISGESQRAPFPFNYAVATLSKVIKAILQQMRLYIEREPGLSCGFFFSSVIKSGQCRDAVWQGAGSLGVDWAR